MFDVLVTNEQIQYATALVQNNNFGQRGYGDGNQKEQLTGMIGQTVLADLLQVERPRGDIGFDGGVDFLINGKRVDIKTMTRTVPLKNHYVHNFIGYQKKYDVDYYIFASYNTRTRILTFGGFVSKIQFDSIAKFYNIGDLRYRDDGTSFCSKAPLYEIMQKDLNQVYSFTDFLKSIG